MSCSMNSYGASLHSCRSCSLDREHINRSSNGCDFAFKSLLHVYMIAQLGWPTVVHWLVLHQAGIFLCIILCLPKFSVTILRLGFGEQILLGVGIAGLGVLLPLLNHLANLLHSSLKVFHPGSIGKSNIADATALLNLLQAPWVDIEEDPGLQDRIPLGEDTKNQDKQKGNNLPRRLPCVWHILPRRPGCH